MASPADPAPSSGPREDGLVPHFRAPRRAGRLAAPSATGRAENPACGDVVDLQVTVRDGRVDDAAFLAQGCSAAIGGASFVADRAVGLAVGEALTLDADSLCEELGGVSAARRHGVAMALRALHAALRGGP